MHKEVYNYINHNNFITAYQSGFIPGESTTFQLLHTYVAFSEAADSGQKFRVLL